MHQFFFVGRRKEIDDPLTRSRGGLRLAERAVISSGVKPRYSYEEVQLTGQTVDPIVGFMSRKYERIFYFSLLYESVKFSVIANGSENGFPWHAPPPSQRCLKKFWSLWPRLEAADALHPMQ